MLTTVTTTAGLQGALQLAQGGDTIQLASGIYDKVVIENVSFAQSVTITSLDLSFPAVLTSLNVLNSKGLAFESLEFSVRAQSAYPFQVNSSSDVSFSRLDVHGSLDGNPHNDASALLIRKSSDVSVTASEFHEVKDGLGHLDSNGVVIAGNYFHDIRNDGVSGGGTSNLTISGNFFTDFYPFSDTPTPDHPDAIQIWTTNTTTTTRNITVSDNIIVRGSGGLMQGIFITDQVKIPYEDITVTDNFMVGTMWNGITVEGASNVFVQGNQVLGLIDQLSWIRMERTVNARLINNTATDYVFIPGANVVETNDVKVALLADGGRAAMEAWLGTHLPGAAARGVASVIPGAAGILSQVDATLRAIDASRANATTIAGTSGNDALTVDKLHDTRIDAGDGADTLTGGGIGHNTLSGGAGNDIYNVASDYDSVVEGAGGGTDLVVTTIDYVLPDNVEILRLSGAAVAGIGNALANVIQGGANADDLDGAGGDDSIQGLAGSDTLRGGEGSDTLDGGAADDQIFGGAGNDRLIESAGSNYLRGEDGDDAVQGGSGFDDINGNQGADTCAGGAGNDWVVGGKDNDRLLGEGGDDLIYGNFGDDTCDGGNGADTMRGGQGNDSLAGGSGNDYLSGDRGDDTMSGGAGTDLFHSFSEAGIDRVLDFSVSQGDRLWLDPGTIYTTAQVGADTIISMDGGQVILVGVAMSSLMSSSIFLA